MPATILERDSIDLSQYRDFGEQVDWASAARARAAEARGRQPPVQTIVLGQAILSASAIAGGRLLPCLGCFE
jgi:predicted lipoprotein